MISENFIFELPLISELLTLQQAVEKNSNFANLTSQGDSSFWGLFDGEAPEDPGNETDNANNAMLGLILMSAGAATQGLSMI